jgi:hypothetical protein
MKSTRLRGVVGLAVMLSVFPAGRVTCAGQQVDSARLGLSAAIRQAGAISGTAWNHDDSPISHALLRLRDVASGVILMGTEADAAGRFTFARVPPGSYVVELVDGKDHVLALGHVFSLGPGETVVTFIRLGSLAPWYDGFFTNAAAAALASAASLGVTAVGEGDQPASARS